MTTSNTRDSEWQNAQRLYFVSDPELWELRNKIKFHKYVRFISVPNLFSHRLKQQQEAFPNQTKQMQATNAAIEVLETLDSFECVRMNWNETVVGGN